MGSQLSVPQRPDDQGNDAETDTHEEASRKDCTQNGRPVMVSTHIVQLYDEVDLGISVQEDSVAPSSPKTAGSGAVAGANGKNLGNEAKAQAPAVKSRFFLTLSRPVPGRAEDRAADSSTTPGKPDVSPSEAAGNKEPSDRAALPLAAAQGPSPDKTPGQTPAPHAGSSTACGPAPPPPESVGAAPAKPNRDASFFDKFFKLDKGQEQAPTDSQQEAKRGVQQVPANHIPGFPGPARDVPAERDIVEGKEKGQEVIPVSYSFPGDPEDLDIAKGDPQTTDTAENNSSIMSFFKTLVSPNKAETKKGLEDTGAENSPTTSADLKSDKANFLPQETQGAAKNPTSTETPKEGAKQKEGPPSLPLSKLFWKKSVKGDGGTTHSEEINGKDSSYQIANSAERAVVPAEPEPARASQKGKEGSSKDKKTLAETNMQRSSKQEAKEPAPCACTCAEAPAAEARALQNGDKPPKRPEKRRQSLGGFFRGLGPKRMLDAQVQTDPVSIGPVGKSK